MMPVKRNAQRGRPGAATNGTMKSGLDVSIVPPAAAKFNHLTTDQLLSNRADLDASMKSTADNDEWVEAFILWCELGQELTRRGHRFTLPEPANGWEGAR